MQLLPNPKLGYLYRIIIKKSSYYESAAEASQVGVIPYLSVITPVLKYSILSQKTDTEITVGVRLTGK